MSADNALFILRTPAPEGGEEFRVAVVGGASYEPFPDPRCAFHDFGRCRVFRTYEQACEESKRIEAEYDYWGGYIEYGGGLVRYPRPFEWYVQQAMDRDRYVLQPCVSQTYLGWSYSWIEDDTFPVFEFDTIPDEIVDIEEIPVRVRKTRLPQAYVDNSWKRHRKYPWRERRTESWTGSR